MTLTVLQVLILVFVIAVWDLIWFIFLMPPEKVWWAFTISIGTEMKK